jgi:hypothetical protein
MVTDLWQAAGHGKQGRTQTRSQEAAQEETAEASLVSGSGAHREQDHHPQALIGSFERWVAHRLANSKCATKNSGSPFFDAVEGWGFSLPFAVISLRPKFKLSVAERALTPSFLPLTVPKPFESSTM